VTLEEIEKFGKQFEKYQDPTRGRGHLAPPHNGSLCLRTSSRQREASTGSIRNTGNNGSVFLMAFSRRRIP
jgi:hypothetical protein